jgi:tetratricopeptide (TPR) repeat protein
MGEDHTLLAPGAEPARAPTPSPAPPAIPPRRPVQPERRRSLAPVFWTMAVLVLLAAVAIWAWQSRNGGYAARGAQEPDTAAAPADTPAPDTAAQGYLRAVVVNHQGVELYREGRYGEALPLLRQATELAPDSAGYRRNLALTLLATGDPGEAEQQLRQALQLDPGLTVAYANLAQAQLAQADTGSAIASLERYVNQAPNGRAREIAQQQVRDLKAARELLGVPIDSSPDTVRQF